MPDLIRKEIVGVPMNKYGDDTRKIHWYVEDEDPISYSNCLFWQEQAGYSIDFYGISNVVIRLTKRKKWQATWNCSFTRASAKIEDKIDCKIINHSNIKIDKTKN